MPVGVIVLAGAGAGEDAGRLGAIAGLRAGARRAGALRRAALRDAALRAGLFALRATLRRTAFLADALFAGLAFRRDDFRFAFLFATVSTPLEFRQGKRAASIHHKARALSSQPTANRQPTGGGVVGRKFVAVFGLPGSWFGERPGSVSHSGWELISRQRTRPDVLNKIRFTP